MSLVPFLSSPAFTLGVELELQIIDTQTYNLKPVAPDILRSIRPSSHPGAIVPEITASMIEVSTGICRGYTEVLRDLKQLRHALISAADPLEVGICGGGTHPFQSWTERRISDSPRFHAVHELYGYLAKQFTVFGQHIHIGCPDADSALLLLHALSRYIPHFIALSASSPFVQGIDTYFHSSRLNSVFAFPLSGRSPFITNWADFSAYFARIESTGIVSSMKDLYWDIRPKPEYGTIEIRVLDTPLTLRRAAALAAYAQCLAKWILEEKPFAIAQEDPLVYAFNRFQACRFGLGGTRICPHTLEHFVLADDILTSLEQIKEHARELGAGAALEELRQCALSRNDDASILRGLVDDGHALPTVVRHQCALFRADSND